MWHIMHSEGLHPFHLQRVPSTAGGILSPTCCICTVVPSKVCPTGISPHGTRPGAAQHRISVNVWAELWLTVWQPHTTYHLEWTLTRISSFLRMSYRNSKPYSCTNSTVVSTRRTSSHYEFSVREHLKVDRLGVVVPSRGPKDN
ncbi:hypothetical protein CEXT_89881 [Caerostris extrusa]|uniref:Uncharacterized protein n=1 Tax=Caerostris extrusa TaxID=172846 RepID=A0AAV4QTN0_CAEEX|nr:hypothetical protein CEXT_89881 [Caerostris extrusa]